MVAPSGLILFLASAAPAAQVSAAATGFHTVAGTTWTVHGTADAARMVLALARAGDYAKSQAAAEAALARNPDDPNLRALLHQVKGRRAPARTARAAVSPVAPTASVDDRPAVLAVKAPKSTGEVPALAAEPVSAGYVPWGSSRLTWLGRLEQNAFRLYALAFPSRSAEDARSLARLRAALDGSESGRAVAARAGGWNGIDKNVDVRLATLPRGHAGWAIALPTPDAKGRRSVLLLSRALLEEPEAVAASVLAHELSHAADFRDGYAKPGLSIQSDCAAHRVQARTFLELAGKEKNPKRSYMWEYSRFLSDLWADRIRERFPDVESFRGSYSDWFVGGMAVQAYRDLAEGGVRPGSAHVDHHLTAPDRGMYTLLTDQKDVAEVVRRKKSKGLLPTPEEEAELDLREKMIARMDAEDIAYRRAHGYSLDDKR